jgi:maltose alpha-D-glucosyltransferase/alpha-amylase
MQWSPDRNAGFSDTNPQKLYLPVILDPEYHYETVNVETQRKNTSSLFWYMKSMISVRKKYKAFSRGKLTFLNHDNAKVLAFTRCYEDEKLLVVVNFSKFTQAAEINLDEFNGYHPVEVVSRNPFPAVKQQTPYFFTLSPHSFHWFLMEQTKQPVKANSFRPSLVLQHWDDILQKRNLELLENDVFRGYLPDQSWFNGAGRIVHSVSVSDYQMIGSAKMAVLMLLLEIHYDRGLTEIYQLPVTFLSEETAAEIIACAPGALITALLLENRQGWLCDAYFLPVFQQHLWQRMINASLNTVPQERLSFITTGELNESGVESTTIKSKIHTGNPSVTAIAFENNFLLRIYRKLEKGIHPDIEMTRFLYGKREVNLVPTYTGVMEWSAGKEQLQLGMMLKIAENHADGYTYMLERFNNYIERVIAANLETINTIPLQGTLTQPIGFEELPDDLKTLLGARTALEAKQFGVRTAQMHLALAAGSDNSFKAEDFSLHYQRSLFSSMQTLVRETIHQVEKSQSWMPEKWRRFVSSVITSKQEILERSKAIYKKKLNIHKIRIHGNLHLRQFLLTGNDVYIDDFLGNNAVSYSERRIKRSAARDIAGVIRSFHNVAYEGVMSNHLIQKEKQEQYEQAFRLWTHYVTGFFMKAYLQEVQDSFLLPKDQHDLQVVLEFFLLRKTMQDLKVELNQRSESAILPLRIIDRMLAPAPTVPANT